MFNLLKGDCYSVLPTLEPQSVDLILCDPPYGKTKLTWDEGLDWSKLWPLLYKVAKPAAPIIVFSAQPFTTQLIQSNISDFRYDIIWYKGRGTTPLLAKKQPMRSHETICVFYRQQPIYNPQLTTAPPYKAPRTGGNRTNSIIGADSDSAGFQQVDNPGFRYPLSVQEVHQHCGSLPVPTAKPVTLLEWLVKTYTNEGSTVLDCCMGSGSAGIACKNTNRNFIGIELDITNYNLAVNRCQ